MTRRSFFKRLAVGAAMLQLRFMPSSAPAALLGNLTTDGTGKLTHIEAHDDCYRTDTGTDSNGAYYWHKGQKLTAEQVLAKLPRRKDRIYHGQWGDDTI